MENFEISKNAYLIKNKEDILNKLNLVDGELLFEDKNLSGSVLTQEQLDEINTLTLGIINGGNF